MYLNGRPFHSTIDTGATVSCLDAQIAKRLHLQPTPRDDKPLKLFGADGAPLKLLGYMDVNVKVNGLSVPFTFVVINNLLLDVLLGIDFLFFTKAKLDFSTGTFEMYDELVVASITSNIRKESARLINKIALPPRSETLIPVSLDHKLRND